jgi:predicted XRE-type DNA-binding protein
MTSMTKLVFDSVFDAIANSPEESADLQFRADLMLVLRSIFDSKNMTQAQICGVLGVPQSRVSELMCGKVDKVSADKLIRYLAKVGYRIQPSFVNTKGTKFPVKCAVIQEPNDSLACA